ncbi:MAG TPA: hypothetical protein VHK27_09225, partial [Gammaproteobacteria bacterium]|nr:hypothetical protein [Gammaproteobacteria bacterium]
GVPSVVFAIPPLARVGLSEDEAHEQTGDLRVKCELTFNWFTAKYRGKSCAGFKTLVNGTNYRILGVHLMGPGAEDVINLFALATHNDVPATRLKQVVLAFPTPATTSGRCSKSRCYKTGLFGASSGRSPKGALGRSTFAHDILTQRPGPRAGRWPSQAMKMTASLIRPTCHQPLVAHAYRALPS